MKKVTTLAISLVLITSSAMAQESIQSNQLFSFGSQETKSTFALLGEAPSPNNQITQSLERNTSRGQIFQLSTPERTKEADLVIYPNPSSGKFKIAIPQELEVHSISVYTMQGKLISTQEGDALSAPQEKDIDLSGEGSGGYIVLITTNRGVLTQRLIVH